MLKHNTLLISYNPMRSKKTQWSKANKLSLNVGKTKLTRTCSKKIKDRIKFKLFGKRLIQTDLVKNFVYYLMSTLIRQNK